MSPRRNVENQQPPKSQVLPPGPRRKKTKSKGSLTNPYQRVDGTETVRLTVWMSKACALAFKRHSLTLKSEDDIEGNEWLEALIIHGINTGFMRKMKSEPAPEPAEDVATL